MTDEYTPKVSIVIPVYNGANYLREAIDSALDQTYPNIEVIVVNDGSNDGGATGAIALSYGNKIRYYVKKNGGVATALNFGIKEMKGEYFSWLSHDDIYYPDKIETQINFLRELKNKYVVLYSSYEYIDQDSNFLFKNYVKSVPPGRMKFALISDLPIHGCTVLLHKHIFDIVGLFDESLISTQDYDLWFRIAAQFDFFSLPNILIKSRIHSEQGVVTIKSHEAETADYFYRCLESIPADEMLHISGENSLSTVYVRLSIKYKRRILSKASLFASELAKKYLFNDNMICIIKNIFLIAYCDIVNLGFLFLKTLNLNTPKKRSFVQRVRLWKNFSKKNER